MLSRLKWRNIWVTLVRSGDAWTVSTSQRSKLTSWNTSSPNTSSHLASSVQSVTLCVPTEKVLEIIAIAITNSGNKRKV